MSATLAELRTKFDGHGESALARYAIGWRGLCHCQKRRDVSLWNDRQRKQLIAGNTTGGRDAADAGLDCLPPALPAERLLPKADICNELVAKPLISRSARLSVSNVTLEEAGQLEVAALEMWCSRPSFTGALACYNKRSYNKPLPYGNVA